MTQTPVRTDAGTPQGTDERRVFIDKQSPGAYTALRATAEAVRGVAEAAGLTGPAELVNIRVSQLNACAYCLNVHTRAALRGGETAQRLGVLAAWRDTELFSPAERAGLTGTPPAVRGIVDGRHGRMRTTRNAHRADVFRRRHACPRSDAARRRHAATTPPTTDGGPSPRAPVRHVPGSAARCRARGSLVGRWCPGGFRPARAPSCPTARNPVPEMTP
ncbi:hypothetical protein SALBM217S_06338 [Streptomyces griseoloalbus]